MASARARQNPVGSSGWVLDERQHAVQCVDENVEEFRFAVSNELEWLNEHMSGILNGNQLSLAEAFKTPGKLKGKTPRTARKRNPLEERAPLTDVFAPTPNARPSPATNTAFYKQVSKFKISEDKENTATQSPRPAHQSQAFAQSCLDSGYHDTFNEEPAIPAKSPARLHFQHQLPPKSPLRSPARLPQIARLREATDARSTGDTFVSANETQPSNPSLSKEAAESVQKQRRSLRRSGNLDKMADSQILEAAEQEKEPSEPSQAGTNAPEPTDVDAMEDVKYTVAGQQDANTAPSPARSEAGSTHSLSDGSSPARPAAVLRKKSSLTFATLPAREPLGNKKSMGARASRTSNIDRTKLNQNDLKNRQSQPLPPQYEEDQDDDEEMEDALETDEMTTQTNASEALKMHSKTSTQRLHERITMLGQLNPARNSKSIPSTIQTAKTHCDANNDGLEQPTRKTPTPNEDDDDWIGPMQSPMKSPAKTTNEDLALKRSMTLSETTSEESMKTAPEAATKQPSEGNLTIDMAKSSVAYPDLTSHQPAGSTTPVGSPVPRPAAENPLSASRSKLFSWARGIFAGSASASAKAKQELLSPQAARSREAAQQPPSPTRNPSTHPLSVLSQNRPINDALPPVKREAASAEQETRRRSSARLKAQAKANVEPASAEVLMQDADDLVEIEEAAQNEVVEEDDDTAAAQPSSKQGTRPLQKPNLATSQMTKHGDLRRPVSKAGQDTATKGRPAPVLVRTASQRAGHTNTMLGSSLHETLSQPSQQRSGPNNLKKKTSNQSIKGASTSASLKSSTAASSSRPKALEAAERKRLQEERDAQRKADQKRELEKRKAAKAEEERRLAVEDRERRLAEQRELEAKNAAQRHAAEQRRQEAVRRNEHMRQQNGADRPVSRMGTDSSRPPVPHINPAKPPKRYWQPEEEEQSKRPQTSHKASASTQGAPAAKRRRTSEVEAAENSTRPTMQPPMRMSTMKNQPPSKFQQGFMSANGGQSMLKTAMSNSQTQHPKTPHDMAKYSHAPPPFAGGPPSSRPPPSSWKTPITGNSKAAPSTVAKSSPSYPNGDNISLPDIMTDSEDSDEDDSFVPPDWANSPALRELLRDQQLVDPMQVFGPIPPISMDEVFKGSSKERQAKFRKRTSSAQWSGPDRLTEEERRKDLEAREKLQAQGKWTFDTSA